MLKHFVAGVALMVIALNGVPASARQQTRAPESRTQQPAGAGGSQQDQQAQARYNIFVMEGVLERAVQHGADRLRRQVRRVMPDMLLPGGSAQARGFRLDGYGVFFDVEVPVMRRSVAWSLRTMLDDNGAAANAALQQIKAAIERTVPDPREKANLMQAIKRLEVQVGPLQTLAGPQPDDERGRVTSLEARAASQATPQAPPMTPVEEDPNGAYEREVITALIDAMLDHSGSLSVGSDEWLTIAARDSEHSNGLMPRDYDLLTIVLRVKGSDLAAFRADRITREEAWKRVAVTEF